MAPGHIVAMGGGGFSMEPENPALDTFVLSLARHTPARVCFVPTASGDSDDGEPQRRPALARFVQEGRLPTTWAADDGAALHFHGGELVEAVASRPAARAYLVERGVDEVVETPIPTRRLTRS